MQESTKIAKKSRSDIVKVSGTTPAQREVWLASAKEAGVSLSEWLREAADGAVVTGTSAADLRAAIVALRVELGRGVGNNLNQIAKALNADMRAGRRPDVVPHEASLAESARDLASLRRRTEALLRRVERAGQPKRARR